MRMPVLSDIVLGQVLPDAGYIAVARVFTGQNTPYPNVPVDVSFKPDPERILATLITDKNGFVVYPTNVKASISFAPKSPKEGHSFFPVSDSAPSIEKSSYQPGSENTVMFYEVKGMPFSWKPYLIAGGVALIAYYLWTSQKK